MGWKLIKLVVRASKASKGAYALLQALAIFADDNGFAWPGIATLAAYCRLSERQIQRLLKELVASGEITIVPNAGKHRTNGYQINIAKLEQTDREGDMPEHAEHGDGDISDDQPDLDGDILADPVDLDGDISADDGDILGDQPDPMVTFSGGMVTFSQENSQKCHPNHVNTMVNPPPPCDKDEFFGDRDPVELLEQQSADDLDESDWVGGGDAYAYDEAEPDVWVERQTVIPRSMPKIPDRLAGLVGGGEWQASEYERSRVTDADRGLGGGSPHVAAPPQMSPSPAPAPAWSMQWPEARKILVDQFEIKSVERFRDLGIPYELIIKQAKALAKTGGGPGAIIWWFKQPENVEHLRAEATKPPPPPPAPQRQIEDRSPSMDALDKIPPDWADPAAWLRISWQLRAKLKHAVIENGWPWLDSRGIRQLVDSKYREETIELLEASGIEPMPPPPPPAQRPAAELIRSHYPALLKKGGNDNAA
ncbi:helix-turn-helix domain-containing protein [Herpetosiphon geysericola]|uniref:Helix-turn-helix domain-containing protein n=1 Tax=Herpetosiphon geysericola TaxID=70996 RepID=A0A0N8GT04_9CHLR|nr:helix-turn-helix domain-containing protein [Herpetosiphon geysericola]KPL90746.1 hypothetical protein SE18_05100 [Herpetosiphon geysericola]